MNIKKQIYLICIVSILYTLKANAQFSLGFDAGITYNKLDYKINNSNLKLQERSGYMASVVVSYKLNEWFSAEGTPGVIQKNYAVSNINGLNQQSNNTYLQLPLGINYNLKIIKRLKAAAVIGGYYAYWMSSKINGIAPNVFELSNNANGDEVIKLENINYTYQFNGAKDKRSEFGWMGQIALDYKIMKNLSVLIKGHFYQSISDQQKKITELQTPRYNQTIAATAGLMYDF
ncbi:porin family protein [Pedobacter sp. AW31-3R]|uniref:porin family protein n=1 Tax=Pedobacter sp. AW31-3R TaxID=3445781 RepID=UPI003FA06186